MLMMIMMKVGRCLYFAVSSQLLFASLCWPRPLTVQCGLRWQRLQHLPACIAKTHVRSWASRSLPDSYPLPAGRPTDWLQRKATTGRQQISGRQMCRPQPNTLSVVCLRMDTQDSKFLKNEQQQRQ